MLPRLRLTGLIFLVGMAACNRQPEVGQNEAANTEEAPLEQSTPATNQAVAPAEAVAPSESVTQTDGEAPVTEAADTESVQPKVDDGDTPDPKTLIRKMTEFYREADSVRMESEQVVSMKMQGTDQTVTGSRELAAERPNRLMIRTTGDLPGLDVYQNDESLVMHLAVMNKYSEEEAQESFEEHLANPMISGGNMLSSFVLHLLTETPYESLMDGVTEQQYLGKEEIAGESVHHVRCVQDQFDWDVWISAEGDPLLKQVSLDMSKAMGAMGGGEDAPQMTMTETFDNWSVDTPLEEETFVFTPPEGVEKVDNLFEGMFGGAESSSLVGEAAPPIELELLDGGSMRLADHAGKDVVMLDFWATWCGPCVEEMPLLAEVAEEYRDKGVVMYAVNQGEEAEEIREFLEQEKLKVTVALDSDQAVGEAYEVQGIPMLVIIGKSGVVQAVHVGYRPNIKETLQQELDDLLAGKNLVESVTGEPEEAADQVVEEKPAEEIP